MEKIIFERRGKASEDSKSGVIYSLDRSKYARKIHVEIVDDEIRRIAYFFYRHCVLLEGSFGDYCSAVRLDGREDDVSEVEKIINDEIVKYLKK